MSTHEEHRRFVADCCAAIGVEVQDLTGRRKSKGVEHVVRARKAVAWALRQNFAGLSYAQIGELLNRDHSSVMYSVNSFADALAVGAEWALALTKQLSEFQRPMAELETALQSLRYCQGAELATGAVG